MLISKLKIFIESIKKDILSESECSYTCHEREYTVNPLCMVLLWADKLFKTMKPLSPVKDIVENIPKKDSANSALDVPKEQPVIKKVDNVNADVQVHPNQEDSHIKDTKLNSKQIEQTVKPLESKKSDDSNIKTVHAVNDQDNYNKKK